ncbi:lipoyl synthase [Pseudomonadota bacterium]
MRVQTPQSKVLEKTLRTAQQSLKKPAWMKIRPPTSTAYTDVKKVLKEKKLNTVCEEARCPNINECWSTGTATFMILGDTCTRACRFCMVKSGNPKGKIDPNEPENLVQAVKIMKLKYAVITCVTRDDLKDGGAKHFASCVSALKKAHKKLRIELLISDLNGDTKALQTILDAAPDVLGHNLETVERLQGEVRDPRANYKKSLKILGESKRLAPHIYTKTSLMVGLKETEEEIIQTMRDARASKVDIITFGQYLRPSPYHLEIKEYVRPEKFKKYKKVAEEMGFLYCASGPFVRSSYRAGENFIASLK